MRRVAVVGAGIAGLTCARRLIESDLSVVVFDKGRVPGGRICSRRVKSGLTFDHGAQYFTARDQGFRRAVAGWVSAGVAAEWPGRVVSLSRGRVTPTSDETIRHVGTPLMGSIGEHLACGVDVRSGVRVARVRWDGSGLAVIDADGGSAGAFDAVAVTAPPPQSAVILSDFPAVSSRITGVLMRPCWAVMLAFDAGPDLPFDGAFVNDSHLAWVARENGKPGRSGGPDRWVLHATPAWSESHLGSAPPVVIAALLEEFRSATGGRIAEPTHASAHRWLYSRADEPSEAGCFWDADERVGAGGDWCHGNRVEGAFLSGEALAGEIRRRLG